MGDLAELRKLLEALPVLHVVQGMGPSDGPPDAPHEWPGTTHETQCRCSVSPSPDVHGWTTDGGYDGYGLPESVATAIATLCNEAPALLDEVERLRKALELAADDPCHGIDRPCTDADISREAWCSSCVARDALGKEET